MTTQLEAVILVSCPDQLGLVAHVTAALHTAGCNILDAAQYTDSLSDTFLQRIHISCDTQIDTAVLNKHLDPLRESYQMDIQIRWADETKRVAIFVSKEDHCLYDLLLLNRDGDLHCDIAMVISNHPELSCVAKQFDVPFHHIPVQTSGDLDVEHVQESLLDTEKIDLIVLARYMRIFSESFTQKYAGKIINIHHSFLPAFAGGKPYHQAYEKGVKLIGATAHYATADLDEGPIIEQGIIRVSHKDSVKELIRKGRDNERTVLARAVRWHLEDRVFIHNNRAIVFS
ncbi:MAG: formyltetrahydrofolate deformylase [Phycisphaerales bacterium]|nr:formyltetrahydrofolate deformylase [Phycisphaerales bacterium]